MRRERVLEELLLGGALRYTQAEIADKSGMPLETGMMIWRALGFPTPPEGATAFTEEDAAALRDIKDLLDSEYVDQEMVLHLSRAVGQTMGRLAGWLMDVWLLRVGEYLLRPGEPVTGETIAGVIEATHDLLPGFERLLIQGWRRQLAASGMRALTATEAATADPAAGTARLAVGFADIVSFTRLSRQMDGDTLAAFVERFETVATEICADHGGRIIKTLGDEVLFCADDPYAAAEIALQITERSGRDDGFPQVRAGLAYGEVILRLGDVFGTPVNLAARLTSETYPSAVLVDAALSAAVVGTYETVSLRSRPLQGLGKVRPWVLRRHH
jgi:adenylate cyclase